MAWTRRFLGAILVAALPVARALPAGAEPGQACHEAYAAACVPTDLGRPATCDDVPEFAFPAGDTDPLGLDHDGDGLACEGVQETVWGDDLCEIAVCM